MTDTLKELARQIAQTAPWHRHFDDWVYAFADLAVIRLTEPPSLTSAQLGKHIAGRLRHFERQGTWQRQTPRYLKAFLRVYRPQVV